LYSLAQSREVELYAARAIMLRLTWREGIEYIAQHTHITISEQGYYTIRRRIIKKGRQWVQKLQKDQDLFLGEYRQRYEEMQHTQRHLWQTYEKALERERYNAAVSALMGYHTITNDLARLIDMVPYLGGGISSKNGTLSSTEDWQQYKQQQQREESSGSTEARETEEIPV
jgi:hypothetical protein